MSHVLAVKLERDAGELRRVAFPAYGAEMRLAAQQIAGIGNGYRVNKLRGLAALEHVLDDGSEKKLREHLSGDAHLAAGHALFEVVFGSAKAGWEPWLKRLFNDGSSEPTRHPVRLRILTEDPRLRSIPWGIMAYQGDYLRDRGWTFEIGAEVAPRQDVELSFPTGILLILPQLADPADNTRSESHCASLREIVGQHMPELRGGQLQIARTREEVRHALAIGRPTIVYYFGHGELTPAGQPLLRIPAERPQIGEDPHRWSAHDIAIAFHETHRPDLVYLNGCRTGRATWQSVASRLAGAARLILAQPTDAVAETAAKVALRFFRRLFAGDCDPIEAATARDASEPAAAPEWLPLLAFADYRSFCVRYAKPPRSSVVSPVDFDRQRQRKMADATVRALVQEPGRRVEAFVAVGPPENHQHEVAGQLHDYIFRRDARNELVLGAPVAVGARMFDRTGSGLESADHMEFRLKLNLGKEQRSELADVIASKAPARVSKRSRILWLDWGVLAREKVGADLKDWLAFCSGRLSAACPDDLRIVVTLAFDVPANVLKTVIDGVFEVVGGIQYLSDRFRVTALDALGPAPPGEIVEFLVDHGCERNLIPDLATWMHRHTKGDYAALRKLIARASATAYRELHEELAKLYGSTRPMSDF